jgi:hypothetical protein
LPTIQTVYIREGRKNFSSTTKTKVKGIERERERSR